MPDPIHSAEKKFIGRLKQHPSHAVLPNTHAVMEGFEYFTTDIYKRKPGAIQSRPKAMIQSQPPKALLRLLRNAIKLMPSLLKNIKKNFKDMEPFLQLLESDQQMQTTPQSIQESYPNSELWQDLQTYAWQNHKTIVGFTELPEEYVFTGKAVPFRYALLFIQEMQKEPIEQAPNMDAGIEVMRVYNSLGIATNDIADWLRKEHQITCMANHPLGGLVDSVPLAAQAGLGEIGRHGMLITKEFGPRCRISPIFIDTKLFSFTDSNAHHWIQDFCKTCGRCVKACPMQAIYQEPHLVKEFHNPTLRDRYENYDREQCFVSFSKTMGCGICIKECPFSKNPVIYKKLGSRRSTEYQASYY